MGCPPAPSSPRHAKRDIICAANSVRAEQVDVPLSAFGETSFSGREGGARTAKVSSWIRVRAGSCDVGSGHAIVRKKNTRGVVPNGLETTPRVGLPKPCSLLPPTGVINRSRRGMHSPARGWSRYLFVMTALRRSFVGNSRTKLGRALFCSSIAQPRQAEPATRTGCYLPMLVNRFSASVSILWT